MSELLTEGEFAYNVNREGGIFGALECGMSADQCVPGELHDAWKALSKAYDRISPEIGRVVNLLDALETEK